MKKLIKDCVFRVEAYEPGKLSEDLKKELAIRGEISKMASNENPLGPSPLAIDAVKKSLTEGHLYPDTHCQELKQDLATALGVSPHNLKVGNGTTELLLLLGIVFLAPCDTFIMSESSFLMAKTVANLMESQVIEVPLKDFRHDLDAVLRRITEHTKIVYLDNPMNPIGTTITQPELAEFMAEVPKDVVVVFDEAYYDYVNNHDYPDTLKYVEEGRKVVVLRTFSKMYGLAGLRVGYCVTQRDFVDAIERVSPPFSVNRFAQVAAVAALKDEEHVRKTKENNQSGKRFLYDSFERMSVCCIPSETNFVTIDIKKDAHRVSAELEREGVIVRHLAMYGKPSFLRVTIGTSEQNHRFVEAFEKAYTKCCLE